MEPDPTSDRRDRLLRQVRHDYQSIQEGINLSEPEADQANIHQVVADVWESFMAEITNANT